MSESSWYDPRIVMRYKAGGEKGLFATSDLKKGELILVFTGKVVGLEELKNSGRRNMELSLQVREGGKSGRTDHTARLG